MSATPVVAGSRGAADTATVRLVSGGRVVEIPDVPADLTVLDWVREHVHRTGTKEGCRQGDCGACTVVVARLAGEPPRPVFRPIDSCITFLRSIDGCALWTVEDLAGPDGGLHPAQQALVDHHGSQCGFCTPGFVMSLYALYRGRLAAGSLGAEPIPREEVVRALSGNLCRCTGYRSIVAAGAAMTSYPVPADDDASLVDLLRSIAPNRTLADVLRQRRDDPDAVVVAGATDVAVWLNDGLLDVGRTISLHGVAELESVVDEGDRTVIGSAVPLEDAWALMARHRPSLAGYAVRFAGPQVRATGTLGGNLVTASPIGDASPVLIALGATVRLASVDGVRDVAVDEFFTGYRTTVLRPDELLVSVSVPLPVAGERVHAYKHSRRTDDDISTVSLTARIVERDGVVTETRIGVGGVAATPARARAAEAAVLGGPLTAERIAAAEDAIRAEFSPIDDVRAGAAHRREVLGALLRRALTGEAS